MTIDKQIADLAVRQHGLFLRSQLDGRSREALLRRLDAGVLRAVTDDVFAVAGAPRTDKQRVMAAVLEAGDGAVASHRTAAALWSLAGFGFARLEVTRGERLSSHRARLAKRHRPVLLGAHHRTMVDGIPCTTLSRTIFDLAALGSPPHQLERLVNSVVNRSPGTLLSLHSVLDELAQRGRPGIRTMRSVLETVPRQTRLPQSGLEMRFERILSEAGEPPLERQLDLGGHEWLGRVDFFDRSTRPIVEVDSIVHHTSPFDRARDSAARDEALLLAGFARILRVPEEHIWYEPRRAVTAVREARHQLRLAS